MKFEHIKVYNFEGAIRGMRNPKNSWHLSDSVFGLFTNIEDQLEDVATRWVGKDFPEGSYVEPTEEMRASYQKYFQWLKSNCILNKSSEEQCFDIAAIGPNDMKLMKQLIAAGSEHRKFMRQIFVSVDITAPLYIFKEFDTYKVSTVANSTSTMHKILSKPITMDCFETGDYDKELCVKKHDQRCLIFKGSEPETHWQINMLWNYLVNQLEDLRQAAINETDPELKKQYWKELIRMLPESWLQTRTWTANYEVLLSIYKQRHAHKLVEWSQDFMSFIKQLPYAQDLIIGEKV